MEDSVTLLAGSTDHELIEKARLRLSTFVANLGQCVADKSNDELTQVLSKEWKGAAEIAAEIIRAVRAGKLEPFTVDPRS